MNGKPISKSTIEAIINKFMEGKNAKTIAYEVKRPLGTVYWIRERFPLLCRPPPKKGASDD